MNLYIETENGQPKNHPALEENLLQAFGAIPEHWEPFVRVKKPIASVYQVFDSDSPTYQKIDGVWTDVWSIRDMTDAEKIAKQQSVRDMFNSREYASNWSAWIFDETICSMCPPIPRPDVADGMDVRWCGADNSWKEIPTRPIDDNQYKFDFLAWNWILV